MYQQSKQQKNSSSVHILKRENVSIHPQEKKQKLFFQIPIPVCGHWLVYGSSAQWRAVNWHGLLHVYRTPIEPWLPCSLSAAQRAQRQLGLKRLPQSMNTNGIDLYVHFLQGDLWTFIAKEEPRPLCVLNNLKWLCGSQLQCDPQSFCSSITNWATRSGAIMEILLCEYNDTPEDWKRRTLMKMLVVWVNFIFIDHTPNFGEWAGEVYLYPNLGFYGKEKCLVCSFSSILSYVTKCCSLREVCSVILSLK